MTSLKEIDPLVSLENLTLNPPTHKAIFCCGFLKLKVFPNLGPNTYVKTGLSSALTSVHATFISRAIHPPPTPMVGVIPNPNVVAVKFACVEYVVISCQLLLLSGTHIPNATVV